ncbi:MAG TPA: hypothetical protein ENL07_05760 [Chlorobaculum parvum]|uniref:Uncharacterized protein n=1 Tax=Chlorobaculum parvum TaxID=274539 RepID=A0A7C5DE52_9CHLB|nr:hypothetical protein [Chlorobaculum parvum]
MRVNRNNMVAVLVGTAIVLALGLRVWWYWPEELHGGPHLDKVERRGRDYSLHLSQGSTLSDIVDLSVFEGYSPSNHFDFRESIENRPSKYVKDDDHHHYVEYIGQHGRMQFHSGYHEEEGISEWLEFLPSDLPLDSFFEKSVAIALDLTKNEFRVYVPMKEQHMYMTIIVRDRKVERIAWMDY